MTSAFADLPVVPLLGVCFSTILLMWYFGGYPLLMGLIALRTNSSPSDSAATPFFTVIIPTYNEETTVEQRVENLQEINYPDNSYEVLFVDSNSEDNTVPLLEAQLQQIDHPVMKLITESERRGKAAAINTGVQAAEEKIVLVSDANTVFDEDVLRTIGAHFADPNVGGVAGRLKRYERNKPPDTGHTSSNQFYHELEHLKSLGETQLDSVTQFLGELSAWRTSIASAHENSLAEDLDLSIQIRKKGYELRYEPGAVAYEPDPETATEQVTANRRRLIGVLQAAVRHWRYLIIPADYYRSIIFPSRKGLQLLSPFLFTFLFGSLVALLGTGAYHILGWYVGVSVVSTLIISISLLVVKSRIIADDTSFDFSISSIFNLIKYLVLMEYTIGTAWIEFLAGKYSVLWEKSESDRQIASDDASTKNRDSN